MNNVYSNVFPNQYAAAPSSKGAFIVPIGWLVTGATRRFATAYPWCTISKHYPLCDERRTVPKLFVIKENLKVVKMSNHQLNYKKKPVGFVDASAGRLVRTVRQEERRRINRAENYARHRDVPEAPEIEESTSTSADREIRFQRWKAERDIRKRIESQKQKPAFKVGVVHHKFYSPIGEKKNVKPVPCHGRGVRKEKHHPTPPKRITRATQKRLEAKLAGTAVTPGMASTSGLQSSRTKSIKNPKFRTTSNKTVDSFAPEHYPFKAPAGLSEVPLFGKFAIPKTTETDKSCSESKIDISFEDEKEEPWPHANHPSVDIMASQKIQSSLVRQNALRFSTDTLDQQNYTNSSIEAVNLRLSSEDESPDETDESEKAESINIAAQLNFSAIAEKIDYEETGKKDAPDSDENVEQIDKPETAELPEMAEVIAIENSTPPRSGSPAPASFSPYIVSSRGKGSARKEQQIKMGIRRSLSGSKIPMKDTVMQNLNISIEEEEQTAQYFKFILDSTIERFTEMCNKWEEIKQEPDLSEDAQYQINQAIGQTNLLMKKKFERFRQLILDCETGKGEMLVTCKDLQGFWDMMYIDVENCNSRFSKLDFLRSKNWIEEQITVTNKRVMKKNTAAPKPKASAKSSARSWIMAARKKMTQSERPSDINIVSTDDTDCKKPASRTPLKDENSRRSLRESPAFGIQDKNSRRSLRESPAFGIQDKNSRRSLRESPASEIQDRRRSTSKATPKKTPTSLLKVVQLSQASKTIRSPLTIIKISKMCKTPEVTLDNTISYVNSDQTPAKGILKKAESSSGSESSAPKSTRKVDFNDDVFLDEVPVENEISEELQNSLDLGRALSRIDTYDEEDDDCNDVATHFMKNVTIRKVEKRLDFEDESFIETENTDTGEAIVAAIPETPAVYDAAIPEAPTIPEVMVVPPTPIQSALKTGRKTTKSSRRSSQILETSIEEGATEEETSFVISPKVLRNRTVPGTTPNKSNRRSIKSPVVDKHLLDSSIKENCEPLGKKNEGSNSDIRDIVTEKEASKEHSKRRRSTRKSIKLNPDGCNTCTPKSNANKSVSAQIMEDLITFDSPINRPIRSRRSSFK